MRAISVLFGGSLGEEAFVPLAGAEGKNAFNLALEQARRFPSVEKTVLLGLESREYPGIPPESGGFSLVRSGNWMRKQVLETISQISAGCDLVYFAWADCPFLDPVLAGALADRHKRYAAEYSYSDGFPSGFSPELLSPHVAGILCSIDKEEGVPVERDSIFKVIQKDINAFDIETEISPVDLRLHRLLLAADSRRNLLLINRWLQAVKDFPTVEGAESGAVNIPRAAQAAALIEKHPELLRTLPAFYNIQVVEACPQACVFCPWPGTGRSKSTAYMEGEKFNSILDNIVDFSSDAVISLSLWGELSLHPQKIGLISMVLEHPSLSLVVETSGIGWKTEELESLAAKASESPKRKSSLLSSPLSWIVSLDAFNPGRYKEIRGPGHAEASSCARKLLSLFPGDAYVQAVRAKGAEDDIEAFYRYWKEVPEAASPAKSTAGHVIIQKYDHFCGKLPKLQASDLSPVKRRPCWHLMREICITLEGTVLLCREDLDAFGGKGQRPNIFSRSLAEIWDDEGEPSSFGLGSASGKKLYLEQSAGIYSNECSDCDEYYTYNF